MRDLPRKLTLEELAELFEGCSRFVARLAQYEDPLAVAAQLLREIPEDEVIEALNAHPAIGARALSAVSVREQDGEDDPAVLAELARRNRDYEERFGFRFVVFVNRRPKAEILKVLRERLGRTREDELTTAIDELVSIAIDRDSRAKSV